MTVLHSGTTKNYSDQWSAAFSEGKAKKKKVAASKKKASPKKKGAKKKKK